MPSRQQHRHTLGQQQEEEKEQQLPQPGLATANARDDGDGSSVAANEARDAGGAPKDGLAAGASERGVVAAAAGSAAHLRRDDGIDRPLQNMMGNWSQYMAGDQQQSAMGDQSQGAVRDRRQNYMGDRQQNLTGDRPQDTGDRPLRYEWEEELAAIERGRRGNRNDTEARDTWSVGTSSSSTLPPLDQELAELLER